MSSRKLLIAACLLCVTEENCACSGDFTKKNFDIRLGMSRFGGNRMETKRQIKDVLSFIIFVSCTNSSLNGASDLNEYERFKF